MPRNNLQGHNASTVESAERDAIEKNVVLLLALLKGWKQNAPLDIAASIRPDSEISVSVDGEEKYRGKANDDKATRAIGQDNIDYLSFSTGLKEGQKHDDLTKDVEIRVGGKEVFKVENGEVTLNKLNPELQRSFAAKISLDIDPKQLGEQLEKDLSQPIENNAKTGLGKLLGRDLSQPVEDELRYQERSERVLSYNQGREADTAIPSESLPAPILKEAEVETSLQSYDKADVIQAARYIADQYYSPLNTDGKLEFAGPNLGLEAYGEGIQVYESDGSLAIRQGVLGQDDVYEPSTVLAAGLIDGSKVLEEVGPSLHKEQNAGYNNPSLSTSLGQEQGGIAFDPFSGQPLESDKSQEQGGIQEFDVEIPSFSELDPHENLSFGPDDDGVDY